LIQETLPERDPYESSTSMVGKVAGFSLNAGVAAKAQQINWLLDGYDLTLMRGHATLPHHTVL